MKMKKNKGILFIAHGSPKKEANDFIVNLVSKLSKQTKIEIFSAFLNGKPIGIKEGFETLLKKGIKEIDIFPYFLTPGGHTQRDIPDIVEDLKIKYPTIIIKLLKPIGLQKSFFELLKKTLL